MTPAPMRGLESQGLPAFGMQPSGMLRIRQGQQERYIWPVHLPGWLAAGWRVAEPAALQGAEMTGATTPAGVLAIDAPAEPALARPEPADSFEVPPASPRGRRGRRRKEDVSPAATDQAATEPAALLPQEPVVLDPLLAGSDTNGDGGDQRRTSDFVSDGSAELPAESAAAGDPEPAPESKPEAVLTALPDDLFDDPLT